MNSGATTSQFVSTGSTRSWPRNTLIVCFFIEAWLIFFHIYLTLYNNPTVNVLGQAFDLTRESSLPTYWSSLVALGASFAAFAICFFRGKGSLLSRPKRGWFIAGAIFLVISIDDAMAFHERLGAITSLDVMRSLHYGSYPWHIVVAPFFAFALLAAALLIWRDLRKVEGLRSMLLLAFFCFGAAFILDYVEGVKQMAAVLQGYAPEEHNLDGLMLAEEVLEIAGTTLFFFVFLSYLSHLVPEVRFSLREKPAPDSAGETAATDRQNRSAEKAALHA